MHTDRKSTSESWLAGGTTALTPCGQPAAQGRGRPARSRVFFSSASGSRELSRVIMSSSRSGGILHRDLARATLRNQSPAGSKRVRLEEDDSMLTVEAGLCSNYSTPEKRT